MTAPETFPPTVEGVQAALRTLDVESWEIAEKLETAGVKGVPLDECQCALAAYVHLLIPDADKVYVEAESVRVEGRVCAVDEFGFDAYPFVHTFQLPDGAQDFLTEFDRREHPNLIEKEAA